MFMKLSGKNWMKNLPNNIDVFKLNLCGTHDCVTQFVQIPHFFQCQNKNIYEQLNLGIRALDIRVASKNGRLVTVHGMAKTFAEKSRKTGQMDLQKVLDYCYKFLNENPSETIIFQFKNDYGDNNEECFDLLFNKYLKNNRGKWFAENRAPQLGEARGKIILIRRCKMAQKHEYTPQNTGIDFSTWQEQVTAEPHPLSLTTGGEHSMKFIVQDRFKYKPIPRWNECILPFLNTACEFNGEYIINYLSTAGGLKGPKNNASYINGEFLKYPLNKNFYYGTIYCDFPTEKLVNKINETNF